MKVMKFEQKGSHVLFDRIVKTKDENKQNSGKRFFDNEITIPKVNAFQKSLPEDITYKLFHRISKITLPIKQIEETDFKLIKCHADCAQMSFDEK